MFSFHLTSRSRWLFGALLALLALDALWLAASLAELGERQSRLAATQQTRHLIERLPDAVRTLDLARDLPDAARSPRLAQARLDLQELLSQLDRALLAEPEQKSRLDRFKQQLAASLTAATELDALRMEQALRRQGDEARLEQSRRQLVFSGAAALLLAALLIVLLYLHQRRSHQIQQRSQQTLSRHDEELSQALSDVGRHNRYLATLAELSRFMQACDGIEETARLLRHFAPKLFGLDAGALYLFAASRNHLERLAYWGERDTAPYFEPDACWGLRRGEPYRPEHGGERLVCHHSAEDGDYLCLPLQAQGETLGLLYLIGPAADNGRFELRFAELAAEQIALSILVQRLREQLRDQAIRDPLTSLYNRRYFEEAAGHELLRVARRQRDGQEARLSLIRLGIDQFKRYNDRHGHDAGDLVLRETARLLREQTRQSDLVCRFGGEEFVVLLPDADGEDSEARAQALRRAIARNSLHHQGVPLAEVHVSFGVAVYGADGDSLPALLQHAEQALQGTRYDGRLRVAVGDRAAPV